MVGRKNKLKWEETKPDRIEAGEFAVVKLDSLQKLNYVLFHKGRVEDFFKDKADAKKQAEKIEKADKGVL